jgi:flagellar biosynthesis regulator FlbT
MKVILSVPDEGCILEPLLQCDMFCCSLYYLYVTFYRLSMYTFKYYLNLIICIRQEIVIKTFTCISNSVCMARFWNNLHQVRSEYPFVESGIKHHNNNHSVLHILL